MSGPSKAKWLSRRTRRRSSLSLSAACPISVLKSESCEDNRAHDERMRTTAKAKETDLRIQIQQASTCQHPSHTVNNKLGRKQGQTRARHRGVGHLNLQVCVTATKAPTGVLRSGSRTDRRPLPSTRVTSKLCRHALLAYLNKLLLPVRISLAMWRFARCLSRAIVSHVFVSLTQIAKQPSHVHKRFNYNDPR